MSAGDFERSIDNAERDNSAAKLRAQGWSYERIASELGWHDRSGARKAVQRAIVATVREAGDELRVLELERLDRLYEKAWEILERVHYAHGNGRVVMLDDAPLVDDAPALAAMDRCLKVQERRAKLLGLDAPVRTEHWTLEGIDAEIARLDADLARRAAVSEAAPAEGPAGQS